MSAIKVFPSFKQKTKQPNHIRHCAIVFSATNHKLVSPTTNTTPKMFDTKTVQHIAYMIINKNVFITVCWKYHFIYTVQFGIFNERGTLNRIVWTEQLIGSPTQKFRIIVSGEIEFSSNSRCEYCNHTMFTKQRWHQKKKSKTTTRTHRTQIVKLSNGSTRQGKKTRTNIKTNNQAHKW